MAIAIVVIAFFTDFTYRFSFSRSTKRNRADKIVFMIPIIGPILSGLGSLAAGAAGAVTQAGAGALAVGGTVAELGTEALSGLVTLGGQAVQYLGTEEAARLAGTAAGIYQALQPAQTPKVTPAVRQATQPYYLPMPLSSTSKGAAASPAGPTPAAGGLPDWLPLAAIGILGAIVLLKK